MQLLLSCLLTHNGRFVKLKMVSLRHYQSKKFLSQPKNRHYDLETIRISSSLLSKHFTSVSIPSTIDIKITN